MTEEQRKEYEALSDKKMLEIPLTRDEEFQFIELKNILVQERRDKREQLFQSALSKLGLTEEEFEVLFQHIK